ncbi:MAG: tetratricopeptide repeat protein [Nitrospira sp.]|jgi:Tfp pilus assembly protein PilF|nr:tetratricopeptide repeat protein [Nitrospira sp.]MBP6607674.1 tetratricopeptide repeat protein [Nitrospira sp.]MCI1280739.1 tetratricopeptide repeat protein [Nitrospira sp.]HQY58978.1 tetratricopeptide repeat protein [Nitrospira sp.]HRA96187.1 tetratricopeptide repeat protein [Nitrospira sp.]
MKALWMVFCVMVVLLPACTHSKPKPLVPLTLDYGVKADAIALNNQGMQAYVAGQVAEAKGFFGQVIKAAPDSGQAHYNYALALNALGDTDQARLEFIEAANLAPGDKVIWDSPALRPFGSPQSQKGGSREHPYGTQRPMIGSGPR